MVRVGSELLEVWNEENGDDDYTGRWVEHVRGERS